MATHDMTRDQGTVSIVISDVHPDEVSTITDFVWTTQDDYPIEFTKTHKYNRNSCEITFYVQFDSEEFY